MTALLFCVLGIILQTEPTNAPATATSAPTSQPASFTVAADGSAKFKTVQAAIDACPQLTDDDPLFEIHIKPGTYKELIYVQREKRRIKLVGDDPKTTIITYNLNANLKGLDGEKIGTFRTPTAQIDADHFACENLTFENSAGRVGQALAIRIDGDCVAFNHCRFLGYQDTIFGNRGRHYFKDCTIVGAVDFIFGGATEFYDQCEIHAIAGGYLTAASTPQDQSYGFVFNHCKVTAEPEVQTLLGRPWRAYASTVFLNCDLSAAIKPAGWSDWGKPSRQNTARYGEYENTGPGAQRVGRVSWARLFSDQDAPDFTAAKVLAGWTPDP